MDPADRTPVGTLARLWSAAGTANPETGWLGRLVGTAVAVGMVLSGQGSLFFWVCLGAAVVGWLFFVATEPRLRVWPVVALCGATLAGMASAAGGDTSGVVVAFTALAMVAMLPSCPPSLTVAVMVAAGATLAGAWTVSGRPLGSLPTLLGVTAFVTLSGALRRQYHLRALETARLLEQTRRAQAEHARAAALDERARIARELHDVLAHSLGALGVQLDVAEALLADHRDVDAALARVTRARRLAADGLTEARTAVAALRHDALPLPEALAGLTEQHQRDHLGPAPQLTVTGTPRPVEPAVGVSLAGVAREALTNAARHAPGAPLQVELDYGPAAVTLALRNGAPTRQATRSDAPGHGLTGMRERLALVDGALDAGPDGPGWAVVARVPGSGRAPAPSAGAGRDDHAGEDGRATGGGRTADPSAEPGPGHRAGGDGPATGGRPREGDR